MASKSTSNSSTERPSDLLSIGRLIKPHGLKGEIVVRLTTNRVERLDPGSTLFTAVDTLVVETSRPKDRDFLVRFVGCDDRDSVEGLVGEQLFAEPIEDPNELWIHDLIGSVVTDQAGVVRGTIESVEANPASDLLVLDSGALVPARFVIRSGDGRVDVDVPDGLFEL